MYIINVVNKRKHKPTEHDFYCGRPSLLGNPFTHIPKGTLAEFVVKSREEAIIKHKEYFLKEFIVNEEVRKEFFKIYDHLTKHFIVNLLCWCAPKSCHCDTIKECLRKQLEINY